MPSRNGASGDYRFGFNGHEQDNEVKNITGTHYDFGARVYDPRLGKFFSVDPRIREFSFMSPYCFAANNPIYYIDKDGEGPFHPKFDFIFVSLSSRLLNYYNEKDISPWNLATRIPLEMSVAKVNATRTNFTLFGLHWAERNVERYLEGQGGVDIIAHKYMHQSYYYNKSESALNMKVHKSIQIEAKKRGEGVHKFRVSENQFRDQQGAIFSDLNMAFGRFYIYAEAFVKAAVDDKGNVSYSAEIHYTFADEYNWKKGSAAYFHNTTGNANHDDMIEMKKLGAKDYSVRSYYVRTMNSDGTTSEASDSYDTNGHAKTKVLNEENIVNDSRDEKVED